MYNLLLKTKSLSLSCYSVFSRLDIFLLKKEENNDKSEFLTTFVCLKLPKRKQ